MSKKKLVRSKASAGEETSGLRAACLKEALKSLAKGERDFSLRDIARRLGVSHGAPYRHFPTKDALLAALAEEGFRTFTQHLRDGLRNATDARDQLFEMGFAYQRFASAYPQHYLLMFNEEMKEFEKYVSLQQAGQEAFATLLNHMVLLTQKGSLKIPDPLRGALFIWSWCHGLATLLIQNRFKVAGYSVPLSREQFEALASPIGLLLKDRDA